jgi:hydrogenase nickel incorporation protein HypB
MPVRTIEVKKNILERNDRMAEEVRSRFQEAGVTAFNLISSPGSGKTTLLERTLQELDGEIPIAVIAGDPRTLNDAERLARWTNRVVPAVVAGEGGCHLDAAQIWAALDAIDLDEVRLVFIENVGNLVCPAEFDLGEEAKIVVFSVTEGEDKPLKYPLAFREARYAILNKIDLLPHLDFDLPLAIANVGAVNPDLTVFLTAARTGDGLEPWFRFLRERTGAVVAR